jgi:sialic acid synthase SpsE
VEVALGDGIKVAGSAEVPNIEIARRSLVAARPIAKGEAFAPDNIACKRLAGGLPSIVLWEILGTHATRDFAEDEPIVTC